MSFLKANITEIINKINRILIVIIPPSSFCTDNAFIIALATTADLTRTINYVIDSGSFMMLSGNKGSVTLDVSGTIESLTIFADQQGDLTLDIKKSNSLLISQLLYSFSIDSILSEGGGQFSYS